MRNDMRIADINIWKKEDTSKIAESQLKFAGLEELDLTNRPINCLKRAGCKTVGDLLILMESEAGLKSVRNLGDKSEAEIIEKVEAFKKTYSVKVSSGTVTHKIPENYRNCVLMRPKGATWDTRIEEYGLPSKSIDIFHSCGVYYVADLYTKNFEKEPSWQMVRSLFASIIAKSK